MGKREVIEVVFENAWIKVERIFSFGVASPVGFWYDSPLDEFVTITSGTAILEFDGIKNTDLELEVGQNGSQLGIERGQIELKTNDSYYIKAHQKHRVKYTSQNCIWLCIYLK